MDGSDFHNLDEDQETNNTETDQDQETNNTETNWDYESDTTQQGWDDNENHWFYSEPVFYRSDIPQIRVDLDFTNANYDDWERAATLIDTMELDLPSDYHLLLEINLPQTNVYTLPYIYIENVNSNDLMSHITSIRVDIEYFSRIINEGYEYEDGTIDLFTFHERIREDFMGRYLIMRILELIYRKYNPDYQPYTFSPRCWPLIDHHNS